MVRGGIICELDLDALRLLVEALDLARQMDELVRVEGVTVAAGSGGRKAHPAIKAGAAARATALRLLSEFGATPASRARVDPAPSPPTPGDPWARLRALQGGKG